MGAIEDISAILRYTGAKPMKFQSVLYIRPARPPSVRPGVTWKRPISHAAVATATKAVIENSLKFLTSWKSDGENDQPAFK
jgi:hypothetical protein